MLSQYTIKNEQLTVTVNRLGAELSSVKDKKGVEYIWQAGEVWPRHAPNLFPIIGSLLDHEYVYKDKIYKLSHHGFARNMEFDLLHQSEHSICFVLQQSQKTWSSYPFRFTLLITYRLEGNKLTQVFRVINDDDKDIPASVGGHPAFNADSISDFHIVFSENEDVASDQLSGPYINDDQVKVIQGNQIELDEHTFDNDALIFQNLRSKYVSLKHSTKKYEVKVDVSDFPYLGIWAKPGAPYVCIEPWQGLADFTTHNKQILEKKGIVIIPVNNELERSFTMEFTS